MLTRKQLVLLNFIHSRVKEEGVSPSFDEMKDALELKSKSGIHRLIKALEERGYIRRLAHRARAIEIIRLPEGIEPAVNAPNVIRHDFRPKAAPAERSGSDAGSVPLVGRIAAGTPIEALQDTIDHITVPRGMLAAGATHYALEVKGNSMTEAGIHEGDLVVIRQQEDARDGEIVVALIEGQEATLKTLRRKGETIELIAHNPAYDTQRYKAAQVKIQGRMVGLIRTY